MISGGEHGEFGDGSRHVGGAGLQTYLDKNVPVDHTVHGCKCGDQTCRQCRRKDRVIQKEFNGVRINAHGGQGIFVLNPEFGGRGIVDNLIEETSRT